MHWQLLTTPWTRQTYEGSEHHDRAAVRDVDLRRSVQDTLAAIDRAIGPTRPTSCGYCRGPLPPGAAFCDSCGTDLMAAIEHRAAHPPELMRIGDEFVEVEYRGGTIVDVR
ncbi:MAG: hypothetical protein ACM4D3_18320 [Candidatus Sericytochromatia bacterium]